MKKIFVLLCLFFMGKMYAMEEHLMGKIHAMEGHLIVKVKVEGLEKNFFAINKFDNREIITGDEIKKQLAGQLRSVNADINQYNIVIKGNIVSDEDEYDIVKLRKLPIIHAIKKSITDMPQSVAINRLLSDINQGLFKLNNLSKDVLKIYRDLLTDLLNQINVFLEK